MLERSQVVLHRDRVSPSHATFVTPPEAERPVQLKMDKAAWEEMGKTNVVTVTIEPADTLNDS